MASKILSFRKWLIKQRYFRIAWFAKDEQILPEPEEALANLPKAIANHIVAETDHLPVPPQYEAAIIKKLKETISQWKKRPAMVPNSVVVLGHPISSISRILLSGIEKYNVEEESQGDDGALGVNLLDWIERPPKTNSIAKQIKQKLGRPEHEDVDDYKDGSDISKEDMSALNLAIIPNLSWCFLRSVEGLEGIDYLQDTLLRDRSQFWIIGSGQVGWDYLNSTLKLNAYCGSVTALPALTGEQLKDWLMPLIEKFEIVFSDAAIHKRIEQAQSLLSEAKESIEHPAEAISDLTQEVSATVHSSIRALKEEVFSSEDTDEDQSVKRDYFDRLADISDGVAIVALQVFIKSLRYKIVEEERAEKPDIFSDIPPQLDPDGIEDKTIRPEIKDNRRLVTVTPKLPSLPELSQSDMYLLYSLMMHSDLTIVAIAESLGDVPQITNNRVQFLRKAGALLRESTEERSVLL
ncbi:MAG: hypothetical protein DCF25_05520 [Leptolyngbya foveolarum]|uniref:Uncharacterized protein n=1 Tax=Leptolyngbya foveolarum TaxID=47253 RepID=A0A2W4WFF6_9CYAN|nr:MAG: hypothetical protein DCF25_05520 [Leptolyngbya foveolarum]